MLVRTRLYNPQGCQYIWSSHSFHSAIAEMQVLGEVKTRKSQQQQENKI